MNAHLDFFLGSVDLTSLQVPGHNDRIRMVCCIRPYQSVDVQLTASDIDALIHLLQAARSKMS